MEQVNWKKTIFTFHTICESLGKKVHAEAVRCTYGSGVLLMTLPNALFNGIILVNSVAFMDNTAGVLDACLLPLYQDQFNRRNV
jgi:hypothetical protein